MRYIVSLLLLWWGANKAFWIYRRAQRLLDKAIAYFVNLLEEVRAIRKAIEELGTTEPKDLVIEFYELVDGQKRKVTHLANLKITQKAELSVSIKDRAGNPAQVDGAPVWSLTDPSLGDLVAAADGLSATLTPKGPLGSCEIQVNADADLGEGVKTILGSLPVDFVAGDAETIEIALGAVSDI